MKYNPITMDSSFDRQKILGSALRLTQNTANASAVFDEVIKILDISQEEIRNTPAAVIHHRGYKDDFLPAKKSLAASRALRVAIVDIAKDSGFLTIGKGIPGTGGLILWRFCEYGILMVQSPRGYKLSMIDVLTQPSFLRALKDVSVAVPS